VMTFCTKSRPASPALRPLCGFAARGRSRAAGRTERITSGAEDGGKRTEGHALSAAAFSSRRHRVKGA